MLAFALKFDDELSVVIFSDAQNNVAGMTRYLRDKFQNLMMNAKHGRSLKFLERMKTAVESLQKVDESAKFKLYAVSVAQSLIDLIVGLSL